MNEFFTRDALVEVEKFFLEHALIFLGLQIDLSYLGTKITILGDIYRGCLLLAFTTALHTTKVSHFTTELIGEYVETLSESFNQPSLSFVE